MELHVDYPEISTNIEYALPPRVHWIALLAAWAVSWFLIRLIAPTPLWDLMDSLLIDAWALYICLWIRKLNSDSMCVFWCGVFVVVELACFASLNPQHRSHGLDTATSIFGFATVALWIVMIWVIRAELMKHYNDHDPIGLHLGLLKSLIYSFIYFQYHLNKIAVAKKQQHTVSDLKPNIDPTS
jgi:hypothetical protein